MAQALRPILSPIPEIFVDYEYVRSWILLYHMYPIRHMQYVQQDLNVLMSYVQYVVYELAQMLHEKPAGDARATSHEEVDVRSQAGCVGPRLMERRGDRFVAFFVSVFEETAKGRERVPIHELQQRLARLGWYPWK